MLDYLEIEDNYIQKLALEVEKIRKANFSGVEFIFNRTHAVYDESYENICKFLCVSIDLIRIRTMYELCLLNIIVPINFIKSSLPEILQEEIKFKLTNQHVTLANFIWQNPGVNTAKVLSKKDYDEYDIGKDGLIKLFSNPENLTETENSTLLNKLIEDGYVISKNEQLYCCGRNPNQKSNFAWSRCWVF